MSCCDGDMPARPVITQEQTDENLARISSSVVAPSDPTKPLASSLRNALPLVGGRVYGRPKIHDDGSIEFVPVLDAAPPVAAEGYSADPDNPWLFRPAWNECQRRLAGFRKAADGSLGLKMLCHNPAVTAHFMRYVTPVDCSACPLRVGPRKNPS